MNKRVNERGKKMSFEKLSDQDEKMIHERSCMILYHFSGQEVRMIQNAARLSGIRDFILLDTTKANNTLKAILDNEAESGEEGIKEKAIIFNHVASTRMNAFIEALKKCRMKRPLMAVVTEVSIDWTLEVLIKNLIAERSAISAGNYEAHE